MWSRQSASVKLRTTKFSSEGLEGNSANFAPAKISRYTAAKHFHQEKFSSILPPALVGKIFFFVLC